MASLPSVPRPVYNELYDTNMTAWLLSTKDNLTQGQILVRVPYKVLGISVWKLF